MKREVVTNTDKGVSAIVGTILIVAITVVLAATVYGVLVGFGGLIGGSAPYGQMDVKQNGNTYSITLTALTQEVSMSKLELRLVTATTTYTIGPGLVSTTNPVYLHDDSGPAYNLTVTTANLSLASVITVNIGEHLNQISIIDTSPSGVIATWTSQSIEI